MVRARRLHWRALAAAWMLAALPASAQQPSPEPPSIAVQGEASTVVMPDTATLTLGVTLDRATGTAAAADLARTAQAVLAQVKADGVADQDVVTGSVTLAPVYPEDGGDRTPRKLAGFRASSDLVVTIRPAERAGTIASHAVEKGANTIEGLDYSASRQAAIVDSLRGDAMRDAQRKARLYVEALGLHLGRVLEIAPGEAQTQRPYARMALRQASAASPPPLPVNPGSLTLSTSVTVRWEIAP